MGRLFISPPSHFVPVTKPPFCNRGVMTWGRNDPQPFKLIVTQGFYLWFIMWGRSPEWLKATSFQGGGGGPEACPPGNFLKWICVDMQSGAFWDNFEKCSSVCTDLVASGWFFRCSYLYPTLHRTLNPKKGKGDCNTLRCSWNPVQIAAAWKCRHNRVFVVQR